MDRNDGIAAATVFIIKRIMAVMLSILSTNSTLINTVITTIIHFPRYYSDKYSPLSICIS